MAMAQTVPSLREFDLPQFRYPINACDYAWTLQASSNLVDWIDLGTSSGCATGAVNVVGTDRMFYRMKGSAIH